MKKTLKITYLILVVLLLLAIGASLVLSDANRPLNRDNTTFVTITVEQGDTTTDIANKLYEADVIDSVSKYELISKVWRYDGRYMAGEYSISPSMSKSEIAKVLISGSKDLLSFTVPEGLTLYEVADLLSAQGLVDREKFIYELENGDFSQFEFLDEAQDGPSHLEGYLFPNTYYLDVGATENDYITTMLNQFDIAFDDEYRDRAEKLGYSTNEIIIIASLIERDAIRAEDGPVAAGVIYNRLHAEMPVDGALQDQLLPPGTVCSPGEDAIRAALYPEESEYLYYEPAGTSDGALRFSKEEPTE